MRAKLSAIASIALFIAVASTFDAVAHAAMLAAPTNASAIPNSQSQIGLSWQDKSTSENGFEIVRSSTGPSGTFLLIGSTGANVRGYNDASLNASSQYCYKVRAFKRMDGKTAFSDFSSSACATTLAPPAPQPPSAPSNAQDLAASYNRVDVYWQDNSSNESGFEVYRGDGTGSVFTRITATASGATYFSDTGLNPSAQYCHKVRAFTTSGGVTAFSAFSNTTCATTPAPPEPPVVRLTAVTTGTDIDADGYDVDLWLKCYWSPDCRYYQTRGFVAVNGTVSFLNRYPGDYVLEISGIAANCDFSSPNPINATMTATASAEASFSAICRPVKKITFVKQVEESSAIFVMDGNAKQGVQLTLPSDRALEPAWSPDGSKIAFRSDRDATSQIYVMNADGSNQIRITDTGGNFRPVWSPDGSKIAFTSDRDGNNEIYVMNADGSGPVNLSNHLADDGDPAWSPDGRKIAFRSNRDGDPVLSAIYVMNADGSAVTRLTVDLWSQPAQPAWSPDGSLIAYSGVWCGYSCVRLILVASAVDGSIQYLTLPTQTSVVEGTLQWPTVECESHTEPAWYPEGRKLTFTIGGECFGGRSVMFWRLDGPQQYEGQTDRLLDQWMTLGFNSSWRR
jgi:dipeptidyl aminopeptidase/acylaminoacyl peptidase